MSKELTIATGTTGQTITANVYLLGVIKATGIACAEIGTTGMYAGDFSATPNDPGVYHAAFFSGGSTVIGSGQIVWDGTQEVTQTGDAFARLGSPAGASVSADIAVIEGQTDDIGIAGAGLTALGDTRLANLDAAVSTRSTYAGGAVASVTGAVGSVTGLTASDVGSIKAKTDQLVFTVANQVDANALTGGGGLDAAGVRSAVGLGSANLDTQLADLPTNAELTTALGTADDAVLVQVAAVKAKTDLIPASPASTTNITAGTITTVTSVTNVVSANVTKVNGTTIDGAGTEGDPWGPQ